LLWRADAVVCLAVDDDDVPVCKVVAVVPLRRIASADPEVAKVASPSGCQVFVVAGRGPCTKLVATPGRTVAVGILGGRARPVCVITDREHGATDVVQEASRRSRC